MIFLSSSDGLYTTPINLKQNKITRIYFNQSETGTSVSMIFLSSSDGLYTTPINLKQTKITQIYLNQSDMGICVHDFI